MKPGTSGLTWILDPIDGTRAFITGRHTWGTLIALHDGDAPVLGIIDQPILRRALHRTRRQSGDGHRRKSARRLQDARLLVAVNRRRFDDASVGLFRQEAAQSIRSAVRSRRA